MAQFKVSRALAIVHVQAAHNVNFHRWPFAPVFPEVAANGATLKIATAIILAFFARSLLAECLIYERAS